MDCQTAPRPSRRIAISTLLLLAQSPIALADKTTSPENSEPTPIVRAFRNDAALNGISFVNPSKGWIVGDRGAIWHTDDGGTSWRTQSSPVSCTLNSVFFIDAQRGWAVGGYCQPYSIATRGVVLRTDDGGVTWRQLPQPLLPLLAGIKFFDRDNGITFGQSASYYPSGIFATRDGGTTWLPLPTDNPGTWLAGDFLEPDAGAVAGPAGQIATLVRRKVTLSPLAAPSLRSFRAMRLVAPTGGWAVGDGGLLLSTNDLGRSWQTPPANLPESIADHFDFRAVAVHGTHVWVAGSPGSRIFHSPDNGKTWQAAATGQTVPLRAIFFIDELHGWAAGDLGDILVTRDGDHSWQMQRTGAQRAALLAIFADAADVPLEMLADSGAADGYIGAIDLLCAQSKEKDATTRQSTSVRCHEAMLLAGAAATDIAWRFPLPPADLALAPEDILEALNHDNDGRAIHELECHLVRELRMWRPDVVITYPAATNRSAIPSEQTGGRGRGSASPQQNLAPLINQLVLKSIAAAADTDQQIDIAADVGLAPWQVKKVYVLAPPGTHGEEVIETGRFSPWLGTTFADFASPARSLLFTTHTPPPTKYELTQLMSRTEPTGNSRGIFSGISLAPGSEARRRQPDLLANDLDSLRRLAMRRRTVEQLLERTEGNAAWLAQVTQMIDSLNDDDAGQLLVQLADGYRKSGRLDLAADTYFLFARRAPDHPLVDPALTWLVRFYASSEFAHRVSTHSAWNLQRNTAGEIAAATGSAPTTTHNNGDVRQATALAPIAANSPPTFGLSPEDRLRRAVQLADYLKTSRPAIYAEPSVRFAEVGAERQLGYANPAKRLFLALHQLPESDPWRQCATTEEWLEKPGDVPPPKKLAHCRHAKEPPHLDGKLDDPIWETADRLALRNADSPPRSGEGPGEGQNDAEVRITHDNEFLYIAIHCPKAANTDYRTDDSPRPRDADLTRQDRVLLRLDVDRDYNTCFDLTVDNRGWTRDACGGDATWDPTWYVAAANDEASWTIEAAIPLAELVTKPPGPRDVWAIAVRRTIPRIGYQTWSAAATSDDSPAQFGLLIFE